MSRHGSARRDRIGYLRTVGIGMADADHHAMGHGFLDIRCDAWPFGSHGYQLHMSSREIQPATELGNVGGAHAVPGMSASGAIVGRDVRSLNVEALHGAPLDAERFFGASQVTNCARHVLDRAGDYGGEQTSHPGGELFAN